MIQTFLCKTLRVQLTDFINTIHYMDNTMCWCLKLMLLENYYIDNVQINYFCVKQTVLQPAAARPPAYDMRGADDIVCEEGWFCHSINYDRKIMIDETPLIIEITDSQK